MSCSRAEHRFFPPPIAFHFCGLQASLIRLFGMSLPTEWTKGAGTRTGKYRLRAHMLLSYYDRLNAASRDKDERALAARRRRNQSRPLVESSPPSPGGAGLFPLEEGRWDSSNLIEGALEEDLSADCAAVGLRPPGLSSERFSGSTSP